jgi:PBP1b-binding outer membrane lipoprotein LpoB
MLANRTHRFLIPLFLLLFLLGCATGQTPSQTPSPKAQALQALNLDKQIYDTTFKTLALVDSQGKLPAKVKAEAIRLGNLYMKAHNLAVQAVLADSPYNLATVRAALDLFLDAVDAYTTGVQ